MTLLDEFNNCSRGEFNKTKHGLDWKVIDTVLYFQPSKGKDDWIKNFLSFPVPVFIGGCFVIIPLGVVIDLPDLFSILKNNKGITKIVGYSRGGWFAVLASLILMVVCDTFGCPGIFWKPSKKIKEFLYGFVTHYENPFDIVARVPPGYEHGENKIILPGGGFTRDYEGVSDFVEMASGHSPAEYRYRIGVYERKGGW